MFGVGRREDIIDEKVLEGQPSTTQPTTALDM
jgi:hypothetical protein